MGVCVSREPVNFWRPQVAAGLSVRVLSGVQKRWPCAGLLKAQDAIVV